MIQEISLYFFILSLLFFSRILFQFTIKLFQENPTPLELSKNENILIYFSLSYIITFILILSGV